MHFVSKMSTTVCIMEDISADNCNRRVYRRYWRQIIIDTARMDSTYMTCSDQAQYTYFIHLKWTNRTTPSLLPFENYAPAVMVLNEIYKYQKCFPTVHYSHTYPKYILYTYKWKVLNLNIVTIYIFYLVSHIICLVLASFPIERGNWHWHQQSHVEYHI